MSRTATTQDTPVNAPRIPGPGSTPLLGWRANMIPLLRDPIGYMQSLYKRYGDIVTLGRGSDDYIFVFSPDYNHQLLIDQNLYYNGALNDPGSPMQIPEQSAAARLFSGITTMNGAKHTQQRRMLMPAFHKKRVEALREEMIALIERRVSRWHVGQEVDLLKEMQGLTLSLAVQTILGLDPEHEGEQVRDMMERWFKIALSLPIIIFPFDVPGSPFHRMLKLAGGLESEIKSMVARRRATGTDGTDALAMMLQTRDEDGTRLTDAELIGQMTALFVAGHETTASALTWTLFFLAQHPPVLGDLMDELRGKLHGDAPTIEQMNNLPLLDGVIKESMRLIPPGLWFLRVATAPSDFGPYSVPQGTRILWSPAITHRMPELYPQPAKFLPERWQSIDPSPYEYLPFGAGPRRCLGATFAMTEMKLVLPIILQRYRIALHPGARIELSGSPLATPRYGMPVKLARPGIKPLPKAAVKGNIHKLVDLS